MSAMTSKVEIELDGARARETIEQMFDDYRSTIEKLHNDLGEKSKYASRIIQERDRLQSRVEALEETLKLWKQTGGYMPVIGVVCDGDCTNAIGVVGVKLADADAIAQNAVLIAEQIGWKIVRPEGVRPMHYCPTCKSKESK